MYTTLNQDQNAIDAMLSTGRVTWYLYNFFCTAEKSWTTPTRLITPYCIVRQRTPGVSNTNNFVD